MCRLSWNAYTALFLWGNRTIFLYNTEQNMHRCLEIWNYFSCSTGYICSMYTRNKFHISAHPCIILNIILLLLANEIIIIIIIISLAISLAISFLSPRYRLDKKKYYLCARAYTVNGEPNCIYIFIISLIIHEEKTKEISGMTVVVYLIQFCWFT